MGHHHNHLIAQRTCRPTDWVGHSCNFVETIIEFIGGFTCSTAILADAVHDVWYLSLGLAWILSKLGKKQADNTLPAVVKTRSTGAFINAVVLIAGSAWVLVEAIPRLWNPRMPLRSHDCFSRRWHYS